MVIYMMHLVHGTKVAISDIEAAEDEKNGWMRYNLEAPVEPEEPQNAMRVKRKPRQQDAE